MYIVQCTIAHIRSSLQLSHGGLYRGKRGYKDHPTESDRMHCVAFVISAMNVTTMHPDMVKKFKDIRNEIRGRGTEIVFDSITALSLP